MQARLLFSLSVAAIASLAAPLAHADGPSPAVPTPAWPACGDDTVVTHDGGMVRGVIAELVPRDHVTLKLATGKIVTVPWSEVHHIEQGGPVGRACPEIPQGAAFPNTASAPLDDIGTLTLVVQGEGYVLEEQRGTEWGAVCTSPCEAVVRRDTFHRITGSGIQTSSGFRALGAPGQRVVVKVNPGHTALLGLGVVSVTLGGAAAFIGYVALPLQMDHYSHQSWPLPTMLIGGAMSFLGAFMIEENIKTRIGQEARDAEGAGKAPLSHPAVRVAPFKEARESSPLTPRPVAWTVPVLAGHF